MALQLCLFQLITIVLLFPRFYCKLCQEKTPSTYVCTLQDGSKIDISSLGSIDGKSAGLSFTDPDYKYYYNPRYEFTKDNTRCVNAAACQTKSDGDSFLLAKQEVDSWSECKTQTSKVAAVCINYHSVKDYSIKHVTVELVCTKLDKTSFTVLEFPDSSGKFFMTVKSKQVCPITSGRLSTGSILCILVSVLLILYLLVGVLVNRFVRGAEGKELVPNYQFWSDFPSLVKDGVLFSIAPCKKQSEYDAI